MGRGTYVNRKEGETMVKKQEAWFWYCSVPYLPPRLKNRLLFAAGGPEEIYRMPEKRLRELLRGEVSEQAAETFKRWILESRKEPEIRRRFTEMEKAGIRLVTVEDGEFPGRLRYLEDRPAGLFVRGELPGDGPSAAIVGSRACSYYGRTMAEEFGRALGEAGVQVISGLARGVDGAGHRGALAGAGRTFGVLGCGVDVIYPPENGKLYRQVERSGGLISEYPPAMRPLASHFPERNRIISGLCDLLVVVEAGRKSGSLITASCALEQGKEIWAVPGRAGDYLSQGTNCLIKDGAFPLTEPEELLSYWFPEKKKLRIYEKKKILLDKNLERVYSCLDCEPKSAGQLCAETGLAMKLLAGCLVELELEGLAEQVSPQYYVEKRNKGEHHGKVFSHRGVPGKSKDHKEISGGKL